MMEHGQRERRPVSISLEQVDDPLDLDRLVERYVEIALRVEGLRVGSPAPEEGRRIRPSTVTASRSR